MGCSGSKAYDELPLVVRCRERRDLIRAARDHRYALADAHVCYLRSLKDVGDALRKFVDEELITASSSPSLSKTKTENSDKEEEEDEESHLHISDSSSDDDEDGDVYYYLKKSGPAMKRVVEEPPAYGYMYSHWNSPDVKVKTPPPPSPNKSSAWDFLNPFDLMFGDSGYYSIGEYGNGSNSISPDLIIRVRETEGIPDLEEEEADENNTNNNNNVISKDDLKGKTIRSSPVSSAVLVHKSSDEPSVLLQGIGESVKPLMPSEGGVKSSISPPICLTHDRLTTSVLTMLSPHGTRDLREVVAEIGNDFEIASGYGKDVAMMLEVGKLPPYHQPSFLKVILSRILYLIAPSLTFSDSPSMKYVRLAASESMKLAKSYIEDARKEANAKVCNLSSTLDKLYAWEKKLYKEVKDEERLRVTYERQCKRLRILDEEGAESGKVYAVEASVRKLLTKLDVSVRAIDVISRRIHELRDEELQPKVAALIQGLIKMWKAMLRCHQKQFQAIMQSRIRKLKMKTGLQTDHSRSRLTMELEKELRTWCHRFNDWVASQKSYVEFLNRWLLHCLQYEAEQSGDGALPYSPGQLGAPPIFVICNDWHQAIEAISQGNVVNTMNSLATSLHQLWEKQDEEERQRIKAEYLWKDYEKLLRSHYMQQRELPLDDDLNLNLGYLRQRVDEERMKHKDAVKLVQRAASSSLKGGLVPIFKALENFALEALQAHQNVRLHIA